MSLDFRTCHMESLLPKVSCATLKTQKNDLFGVDDLYIQ